jgi:hypothetical protein
MLNWRHCCQEVKKHLLLFLIKRKFTPNAVVDINISLSLTEPLLYRHLINPNSKEKDKLFAACVYLFSCRDVCNIILT